MLKRQHPQ
ncbi:hypothetical protein A483_HHAL012265, partial [Halyomorpha halys]